MSLHNYLEMRDHVDDADYKLKRLVADELQRRHPERFMPHYAMVSFSALPYLDAETRTDEQEAILDSLVAGANEPGDIDWQQATALVQGLDALPASAHWRAGNIATGA